LRGYFSSFEDRIEEINTNTSAPQTR
jgi:hypothetical protein